MMQRTKCGETKLERRNKLSSSSRYRCRALRRRFEDAQPPITRPEEAWCNAIQIHQHGTNQVTPKKAVNADAKIAREPFLQLIKLCRHPVIVAE